MIDLLDGIDGKGLSGRSARLRYRRVAAALTNDGDFAYQMHTSQARGRQEVLRSDKRYTDTLTERALQALT